MGVLRGRIPRTAVVALVVFDVAESRSRFLTMRSSRVQFMGSSAAGVVRAVATRQSISAALMSASLSRFGEGFPMRLLVLPLRLMARISSAF